MVKLMRSTERLVEKATDGLHKHLAQKLFTSQIIGETSSVLDIGCGTGAWLKRLQENGLSRLYGLDIEKNTLEPSEIIFFQCDLNWEKPEKLDKCDFDLITAIEVVEHLENLGCFFNFIESHLSPDGYFILTTPNLHSLTCKFRYFLTGNLSQFDFKGDADHIYPVFLYPMSKIMERHGLSIVNLWTYPESGGSQSARKVTRLLLGFMRVLIKDQLSGDNLCLLVRKV